MIKYVVRSCYFSHHFPQQLKKKWEKKHNCMGPNYSWKYGSNALFLFCCKNVCVWVWESAKHWHIASVRVALTGILRIYIFWNFQDLCSPYDTGPEFALLPGRIQNSKYTFDIHEIGKELRDYIESQEYSPASKHVGIIVFCSVVFCFD